MKTFHGGAVDKQNGRKTVPPIVLLAGEYCAAVHSTTSPSQNLHNYRINEWLNLYNPHAWNTAETAS